MASVIVSDKKNRLLAHSMRVCQNRLPEQPAKSGLRNFMYN